MEKKRQSIDGFTPRRRKTISKLDNKKSNPQQKKKDNLNKNKISKKISEQEEINRVLSNIDIDNFENEKKEHYRDRVNKKEQKLQKKLDKLNLKRERKGKKILSLKAFKMRRFIRRCFVVFFVIIVGYFGHHLVGFLNKGIQLSKDGNIFGLLQKEKLKQDSNGRTNFLIFGTSPKGWDGEDLTDSVILVSLNQENKKAHTVSLSRDLWVKRKCSGWLGTSSGKLNEVYGCGKFSQGLNITDERLAESNGQNALAEVVEEVTGLDVHYKIHANWQALVQAIDAVGGIDVKVEVWDGSPYMYDVATNIRYKNGEVVHMDGARALAFSRARGSAGGYGLSGGNFDRERNQQKIIQATLAKINASKFDFSKLQGVMSALGDNINTTFEAKEFQTLFDLAMATDSKNIKSLPLINDEDPAKSLLTTSMVGSASAVIPTAGTFDYSDIQAYIAKNTISNEIIDENAKIIILNGTQISGLAAEQKTKLSKDNYNIIDIDSAPKQNYKTTQLFLLNSEKTATIKKLESKFDIKSTSNLTDDLLKYKGKADILIILGEE